MWSAWFGGYAQPSDFATAESPSVNFRAIVVSSIFIIPYISFLIILPGVRQKRIITLLVFTITTAVGASLAASLYWPGWAGGSAQIVAQFRSHANERILARIGVHVGLQSINVTLKHEQLVFTDDFSSSIDWSHLSYNEKFDISGVSSMSEALHSAYEHGLPYPMLSVLEYFSLNQDAFDWGRHYRTAGHYTHAAIVFALSCWCLSVAFLLFLPHHFGKSFLVTGLSSLFACLLYLIMSPCQLRIGFVGVDGQRIHLDMSFQWAFYLIFAIGILAMSFGLLLIVLQNFRVYTLSTFLEAHLDDTVGPKKRNNRGFENIDTANNIDVMKRCKTVSSSVSSSSEKFPDEKQSGGSSGFQSRTSYSSHSLRSHSGSFESVHDAAELERSVSQLTIPNSPEAVQRHITLSISSLR
ncbi:unnamed protein product [Auanema sp. JU1783]|nr:unnamed protein product [Auanema sp. JU1783]